MLDLHFNFTCLFILFNFQYIQLYAYNNIFISSFAILIPFIYLFTFIYCPIVCTRDAVQYYKEIVIVDLFVLFFSLRERTVLQLSRMLAFDVHYRSLLLFLLCWQFLSWMCVEFYQVLFLLLTKGYDFLYFTVLMLWIALIILLLIFTLNSWNKLILVLLLFHISLGWIC